MAVTESIGDYIRLVHKTLITDMEKMLKQQGFEVGLAQWGILEVLWEKDGLTQQQLADAVGRNKAGITRILDNMEKKKLLERKLEADNRRIKRVVLTNEGRNLQARLNKFAEMHRQKMENQLTAPEINVCIHSLKKVIKNLTERDIAIKLIQQRLTKMVICSYNAFTK